MTCLGLRASGTSLAHLFALYAEAVNAKTTAKM